MSTEKWLKSIHLQQYIAVLEDAGYDSTTQCASLTDTILRDIGVTLLGHRKRIMAYLPKVAPMESPSAAAAAEMPDESTSDDNSAVDECIYDVPPSHSEDDVFRPGAEGPLVPPVLPPKKRQVHESIDERLGMVTRAPDANPQRPVPVPRKTVNPKKPVPRPRTKRRSLMPGESHDLEFMPVRESMLSDDVTKGDGVVTKGDDVVTHGDVTQVDTVVTEGDGVVTHGDNLVTKRDDVTQGLAQCQVQSVVGDEGDSEGHLELNVEREERTNTEPHSETTSAVYDDVYVSPDDILIDSDGTVTIATDTRDSDTSDIDDACRGDYIVMDDELLAGIANGNTDPDPGPVEDRVVIGAESDDPRADSQSSEEIYGQVWVMNSGKSESTVDWCDLSLKSSPLARASIVSFCAPPPSYAPPPLPQGVLVPPDIPDYPPPSIPPRPVGYKPPPPTATWGVAGPRPESIAFSEFVSERFESEKQAELNDACSSHGSDCSTPPPKPTRTMLPSSREASPYRDVFRERSEEREDGRPKPPPRVPNPFQSMYDPVSRTYSFDIDLSPAAEAAWESDDNLSDGGDFFEEEDFQPSPLDPLKASIPVVPAVQNNIKERKGYLYKCASKRSKMRGWVKEWVSFDGKHLKYFSNDKSVISKRIIPLASILNVTNGVKAGEQHPFRFQVITVDRVYTFATDEIDDLSMWANILMRAVIENESSFEEGGEMKDPSKQGFVKIEGARGKRYLAVKCDQFAYYNTYNDYKAGCPIHVIEMKLASVKERTKMRLQLTTPYAAYILMFEASDEMGQWKEAFEEATAEGLGDDTVLTEVYKNHSNRLCADCGQPDPYWASINIGITLCKHCAGIHRGLGVGVSKVRSLRMDMRVWTPSLIQMMVAIGNDEANNFWEWNNSEEDAIDPSVDMPTRSQYITDKYRDKRYCRFHPLRVNQQALDEALCKAAQFGDVIETLHLLFSGANILHRSEIFNNETPLMLAKKASQTLQVELLSQNGGDGQLLEGAAVQATGQLSLSSAIPSQKGYLYKTGSNQKGEFLRRWCYLEQGTLAYYENEKVNIAKDAIDKRETLSIQTTTDDRFEFTFELNTTKHGGRVYLFAAEYEQDRDKWVVNIAKNFAPVPVSALKHIQELDRGGVVFIREGATNDWCKSWMHKRGRTLHLYSAEKQEFEEIDLRKVTSIMTLQSTGRCIETYDEGQPFVVDLPNRALYIQGDTRKETEDWFKTLHSAATESGTVLSEQQLTSDDTPVLIDKCINFIAMNGLTVEGIYRQSGQHSKITRLLKLFSTDARSVHLRLEEYSVHDVCTVMKRFLRHLNDPLLTHALYPKWLEACTIEDESVRLEKYKYLLGVLPRVNYVALKKLTTHLCRVAEQQRENKMNLMNIASIFGPVLMAKQENGEPVSGYGGMNEQISTINDLLVHHQWLFEVKANELEHERKIEEAIRKMEQLTSSANTGSASDLLLGVYLYSIDGQVVMLKVPPAMTAEQVLQFVVKKAELDPNKHWGIFEVICGRELQRPLHYSEKVLEVTLCWGRWPDEFCRDNYLCVKENTIYEKVDLVFDQAHGSLYGELRLSERKGFKKFHFEFSQYKLMYHKDTKGTSPLCSWNVEDLTVYIGVQSKRSPPTRWGFTFIVTQEPVCRGKDNPFFGYSACCDNEEELYRWIAAILHAQHSGCLESTAPLVSVAGGIQDRANSPSILNMTVPLDAGFNHSPKTHRPSLFRKFRKK